MSIFEWIVAVILFGGGAIVVILPILGVWDVIRDNWKEKGYHKGHDAGFESGYEVGYEDAKEGKIKRNLTIE
jgi:hypothetical protein